MKRFKGLMAGILAAALAIPAMSMTVCADDTEGKLIMLNWGNTEEERIANEAIARFNEEYPNVTVEMTMVPVESWSDYIQKWIIMSTSGETPDIISLGLEGAQMAVSNDLLMPLDDIVAADETLSAKKGEYAESLLKGFSVDDVLYGLPNGTQTMVVYYNKEMFDAAGVDYPQDGWTWDEFMETAKTMTSDDVYGFGLSSSYFQLTPWWATNDASPAEDGAPALNSENMVEAVTFLKQMVDEGVTPDPISSDVYTMFASKQLAMVGAGRWVLNSWQEAGFNNDNFDCVQWPVNKREGSVYGGSAWCLGSATQQPELATALLKYMVATDTLTEVAAGGQQIPPTEGLATDHAIMGDTPDNIDGLWKAITIADPVCAPTYFGDIEQSLLRAMEEVFSGAKEPQAALDDAQAELEGVIG